MSNGAVIAAAAAAQIGNAIKASGAIVCIESSDFEAILKKMEAPLVVHAQGGVFSTKHKYLTSYKGLIFFAQTQTPLILGTSVELVEARKIYIPE